MVNLKTNNLLNRLQKRLYTYVKPLTLYDNTEKNINLLKVSIIIPAKIPSQPKISSYSKYQLLEKRLGKKLAAKGLQLPPPKYDCTHPQLQAPIKKKGGFMENIGEIIDCNYNTIPIPKKQNYNA